MMSFILQKSIHALRQHVQPTPQPPSILVVSGYTVNDAVCAVFSSWRGARGHGTADLLTEKKKMIILTSEDKKNGDAPADGFYVLVKQKIMNGKYYYDLQYITPE